MRMHTLMAIDQASDASYLPRAGQAAAAAADVTASKNGVAGSPSVCEYTEQLPIFKCGCVHGLELQRYLRTIHAERAHCCLKYGCVSKKSVMRASRM